MQRTELVKGELSFSRMIQGYWRLTDWQVTTQQLVQFIEQGLEMGITTTDHADVYGAFTEEGVFGKALKAAPHLREQIEVVTKCGILFPCDNQPRVHEKHYNTSTDYIIASAERSLKELCIDTIDVLLIHRPDPLMDADAVAEAFHRLQKDGKVRHFGVSNFTVPQFELLQSRLETPLVTNQLEISAVHSDYLFDGNLDFLQQQRIAPMAWSCLGGGDVFSADEFAPLRKVAERIGEHYNASLDQILLAFVLALPCQAMPLLGSGNIERIRRQVQALDIKLDRQHWFALLEAARGVEVP
ncbi:putative oxidoreductase YcsN [Saliniradius amylolyticus]|uniref:Putative oxidoreductase YcsN n=1 Tax=Saliniradius amylolyticus TaxID=2183582 RepID=A0A2S2E042_9ALTE|nr:aldo/keto reductase [Saliniradius amylolyticus]AWL10996.1 putative oxidoreductase YcsN [Saliniradius amylolyticus]